MAAPGQVGVMDMLPKFTIGHAWTTDDFGNPSTEADFKVGPAPRGGSWLCLCVCVWLV